MASISYEDVYSDFLGLVTDYNLMSANVLDAKSYMNELMRKAIRPPYIRRLFSSISFDDDAKQIGFELKNVVDADADVEFTKFVIANSMVVEWIEPQVKKTSLIAQMFGGREQKFYAQANQIAELRGLLEDSTLKVRKAIRDRGYIYNPYLGG